jgi:hypothetical protein
MSNELQFLVNVLINFLEAFLIVRVLYCSQKQSRKFVFTFLTMNSLLFLIFYFSGNIAISFGVGFGLFAIFRVLRFRTDPLSVRDMSYLFIILALAMVDYALLDNQQYLMLLIAYAFVFGMLLLLEKGWGFKYDETKSVRYEKIDLIKPENRELLIHDLEERTGLKISNVEIEEIDFLQDTADLKIFYKLSE